MHSNYGELEDKAGNGCIYTLMKELLIIAWTAAAICGACSFLTSCGGPRSYQVEAHAGAGMTTDTQVIGRLGSAAAPVQSSAASMAQSEAIKSQAFFGR